MTGKTRKVQANKTNYMSDEAFSDLKEAMEDALAFERGNLLPASFKSSSRQLIGSHSARQFIGSIFLKSTSILIPS